MKSGLFLLLVIPAALGGCCKSNSDSAKPADPISQEEKQTPKAVETPGAVDDSTLSRAIISFYNNWGEWKGKFRIDRITQMRIDTASPSLRIAHVEYKYQPLPGNATPPGVDRRTFELVKEGGEWAVKSMGANLSATFEDDGWSDKDAISTLTTFYNTKGEWVGQFTISAVTRYRIDRLSSTTRTAYVGYTYEPSRGNSRSGGQDYRTFSFRYASGSWDVTGMGKYNSAVKSLNP